MRIVRRSIHVGPHRARTRARGIARHLRRQGEAGTERVQGAQLPAARNPIEPTRPGLSDQSLAAEWQLVEQRAGKVVFVIEEAGPPFVFPIVQVLRVSARSGGLAARALVALGVRHAVREGVSDLVFQAEPETLAQMRLESVVLLIAFRCRTGNLRDLCEQRRIGRDHCL